MLFLREKDEQVHAGEDTVSAEAGKEIGRSGFQGSSGKSAPEKIKEELQT